MSEEPPSGLAAAAERVGDRWTLQVIGALLGGARRFSELQQAVPGVATNVLAGRLKDLERHGLVVGEPYSHRPLRVEYRATARASELSDVLRMLSVWGAAGGGGEAGEVDRPAHAVCGTPLEVRYWCPTCHEAVTDEDEEVWL